MKKELYTRKDSLRLKGYDYSARRIYFITIVVKNRETVFYNRELSNCVIECLKELRLKMKFNVFGFCLMPEHFHALIGIGEAKKSLGEICGAFKSLSTREFWRFGNGQLWQKSYHDHIVRNETDFFECLEYIKENPKKRGLEDWTFVGRFDYLI